MTLTDNQKAAFALISKAFALFAEDTEAVIEDERDIAPFAPEPQQDAPQSDKPRGVPAEGKAGVLLTCDIDTLNLIQLKEFAGQLGINPQQTKSALIAAIKAAQPDDGADVEGEADEGTSDGTADNGVTVSEVKGQLSDFEDSELLEILADAKINVKGKRSVLLQAITDAVNAGKVDLNDYFEEYDDSDDDNDDDEADDTPSDKKGGLVAADLVDDWSDKDIKDLLETNEVKFGKKASRAELIDILQTALDNDEVDLSEYDFEE